MPEKVIEQLIVALASGAFTFVGLTLLYRLLYKRQQWRSHLFEVVLTKVRTWVYLTCIVLSIKVTTTLLPQAHLLHQDLDLLASYALITMGGTLGIEIVCAFFFDYVLADVRRIEIPTLYRDITRFALYTLLLGALFTLLGFDVRALVTGGTVLTLVIGFATQESLGNVFAGIFLHGSRPFTRGDWIKLGEREGQVDKVEWRATTIRTREGDYVVYPNAMLAKMDITNFSAPSPQHALQASVNVDYKHSPNKVKKVMIECALKTPKVLTNPAPVVHLRAFEDSAASYRMKFWIDDFTDAPNIHSAVMEKIWYHFRREDLEIPYPIRTLHVHRRQRVDREGLNFKLLKHVDFLSEFSEHDLKHLAARLKVVTYATGEAVIKQGDAGRSFYIVREGRVEIQARNAEGVMFFTKELGPGAFFGEMSLLTGDPRTATVVALEETELLRLDKEAFRKIMEENPRAEELISTILERRQEYSAQKKAQAARTEESADAAGATSNTRAIFVQKIRDFFAY